jgi:hypothetical protein
LCLPVDATLSNDLLAQRSREIGIASRFDKIVTAYGSSKSSRYWVLISFFSLSSPVGVRTVCNANYYYHTENLGGNLFAHSPQPVTAGIECGTSTGTCPPPTDCTTTFVGEVDYYWALGTIVVFQSTMNTWLNIFNNIQISAATLLKAFTTQFPKQNPVAPPQNAVLANLGAVFAIVGAAATVNPAFEVGAISGAILSTLGGIASTVASQTHAGDGSSTDAGDIFGQHINNLLTGAKASVTKLLGDIVDRGNLSAIPAKYTTGTYQSPIANFFDNGNYIVEMNSDQEAVLTASVTKYLQANLIGSLLAIDNWWILQDAYTLDECHGISSGMVLNLNNSLHCYTLESFGTGYNTQIGLGNTHNIYSVPALNSTLTAISTYGMSLADIYTSSVNCQLSHPSSYGGSVQTDYQTLLTQSGANIPTCFYSLPVFYVKPSPTGYVSTPCQIYVNNRTATVPLAGLTFFPDNIGSILTPRADYCCQDTGRQIICAFQ